MQRIACPGEVRIRMIWILGSHVIRTVVDSLKAVQRPKLVAFTCVVVHDIKNYLDIGLVRRDESAGRCGPRQELAGTRSSTGRSCQTGGPRCSTQCIRTCPIKVHRRGRSPAAHGDQGIRSLGYGKEEEGKRKQEEKVPAVNIAAGAREISQASLKQRSSSSRQCETFKREEDLEVCGEAENGRDAIEKAQRLRPDLIVLDLSMPVMNGLDAARVLKRLMPLRYR
jgi:CheY-like chemotaxis protein